MRSLHHTKPVATTALPHGPHSGAAAQAGRFALHYLEMCIVMCVTAVSLSLLATRGSALVGSTNPRQSAPVLSALVVTAALSGSMVLWMRYMEMSWQPTLEMVAATLLAGAVLVIGYSLGGLSAEQMISGVCPLACVAMLAVMLPRFKMYSSHPGRH